MTFYPLVLGVFTRTRGSRPEGTRYYRGGTGESSIFLGAAVSHLEGTKTNQRAAVWESTGPPPWLRGGIWLYPDEHNQFFEPREMSIKRYQY